GMSSSAGEEGKSAAAPTSAGTYWPPPSVSPRLSRNWTVCATTSTLERLLPSCASHDDQSSRPSTPTRRPLARCWARNSAWLPNTFTSKKFGLSTQLPAPSCWRPFTARPSRRTGVPEGRCCSSGSRVSRPTSVTRLMSPAISILLEVGCRAVPAILARGGADRYWLGVTGPDAPSRHVPHDG